MIDSILNESRSTLFMQFAIMLGLLFAATKIASSLSIAGASWANDKFGKFVGVASGAGLAARGLRATAGRASKAFSENKRIKDWAGRKGSPMALMQRNFARMALDNSSKMAKKSMDFRDSKLAKALKDATGVGLGKGIKSYEAQAKEDAKFAEQGAKAASEREYQTATKALEAQKGEQEAQEEYAATLKAVTKDQKEEARLRAESEERASAERQKESEREMDMLREQMAQKEREIERAEQFNAGPKDMQRLREELQQTATRIDSTQEKIDNESAEKARIQKALASNLQNIEDETIANASVLTSDGRALRSAQKKVEDKERETDRAMRRFKDKFGEDNYGLLKNDKLIKEGKKKVANEYLDKQAEHSTAPLGAGRVINKLRDDRAVNSARKNIGKSGSEKQMGDLMKKLGAIEKATKKDD